MTKTLDIDSNGNPVVDDGQPAAGNNPGSIATGQPSPQAAGGGEGTTSGGGAPASGDAAGNAEPDPAGWNLSEDQMQAFRDLNRRGIPNEMRPDHLKTSEGRDERIAGDGRDRAADAAYNQEGSSADEIYESLVGSKGNAELMDDGDTAEAVADVAAEAGLSASEVRTAALDIGQNFDADSGWQALVNRVGDEQSAKSAVDAANAAIGQSEKVRSFLKANPAVANSPSVILSLAQKKGR